MKIDTVIGNPPYNDGLYIDFVILGHELADNCSCFVTPSKWHNQLTDKNGKFREMIVPFIHKLVHYPSSQDLFNIREKGGVGYYLITRDKRKQYLKIVSSNYSLLETGGFIESDYRFLVNGTIKGIIDKVKNNNKLVDTLILRRQYFLDEDKSFCKEKEKDKPSIEVYGATKDDMSIFHLIGYTNINELNRTLGLDKYKVICHSRISACVNSNGRQKLSRFNHLYKLKPNQVNKGSYLALKFFDTEDECDSFISYIDSKLIGLLFSVYNTGNVTNLAYWELIPYIDKFDHIYTDNELYKKYGLTEDEINFIENIMM